MGTCLASAMVVFKSVLQFLFVFCIHVTYCKPAHDEQPEISGTGSTFWGWVTYLNPWGSAETSASPMTDKIINPKQTKIIPAAEARKLTPATISVRQLTAQISTSEKYMEIPLKTVRIMATTELMAKQLLELKAATTDPSSDQNNLTSERIAVESSNPTVSAVKAQDNPTTEFYLETEVPTTLIATAQDISTSSEEPIAVDLTTPTAWDLTTTAETVTEQPLEVEASLVSAQNALNIIDKVATDFLDLETSRSLIAMDQTTLISSESTTEQLFEQEVTTIFTMLDTENPTKVKEPLDVSKHSSALNTIRKNIIKGETARDYLLAPELPNLNSVIVPDFTTMAIDPTAEPSLESELVSSTQELESQTTLSIYQYNTRIMEEFGSDQSLQLEATTSEDHLLEVEISSEAVSTLSTILDDIVISGREQYEIHMGTDEPSTPTHTTLPSLLEHEMVSKKMKKITNVPTVSYEVIDGGVSKIEDGVAMATEQVMDPYISLKELMFKPFQEVIILTEPTTDSYTSLHPATFKPIEGVSSDKNAYERVHEVMKAVKESTFTESATNPYPETVAYPEVSERHENFAEISEALITTEYATHPYLKIEGVSERDEGILPGAKIEEVSVAKVLGLNQLVETKETVLDEVNKMSMETNAVLTALSDEMLTENDERVPAVRFSRSQSAGSHLRFDHVRLMILLFAVYFMKT